MYGDLLSWFCFWTMFQVLLLKKKLKNQLTWLSNKKKKINTTNRIKIFITWTIKIYGFDMKFHYLYKEWSSWFFLNLINHTLTYLDGTSLEIMAYL